MAKAIQLAPEPQQEEFINNLQQTRLMQALRGATQGIAAALEQDSITPTQVDCLLTTLIERFEETISDPS